VHAEVAGVREVSQRAERLGSPPPGNGRQVRTLTIDNYLVPGSEDPDDQRAWDLMLRATRESWVNESIDARGMRPRQAAETGGDARAELQAILDDMHGSNDRNRDQGRPARWTSRGSAVSWEYRHERHLAAGAGDAPVRR
jgi:hypothetical protein